MRQHKVSLRDAHKGTLEIDTLLLDSYGELPANERQFYLDARKVFQSDRNADFSDQAIVEAARKHSVPLMGGPMLGDLKSDGVTIWMRPASESSVSVALKANGGVPIRTIPVGPPTPGKEVRLEVSGLSSGTPYSYEILSAGAVVATGNFVTAPAETQASKFRVTFGSCCHKIGVHNPNLFRTIVDRKPSAMMLLGDIAVDDRENRVNMHRSDYQLRDVSAAWRHLAANVPLYASWDDHDYFNNDLSGVPRRFKPADRDAVREVYQQNWNNPSVGADQKGIYFSTRVGPVEIIMLDTRSCRNAVRRNQYGAYLGKAQMEWLKQTLQNSSAPFKIISSGTMWSDYVSKAKDSWGSWDRKGREEIFQWIEDEAVGGVLLVSGDRHGARGFKIPRPSGFEFFEFEPATLGGVSGPGGLVKNCPEQIFGYDGGDFIAFGEFTFDTDADDPAVTFRLIRENGVVAEEHTMTLQQLTPPNAS